MQKLKVKIIAGFRKDQEHTIDAEEAHIAYRLFMNPDKRAIFSNGIAIKGSDIRSIVPDYHATMGWNASHFLNDDDWNEMNKLGVRKKLLEALTESKELAKLPHEEAIKLLEEKLKLNQG